MVLKPCGYTFLLKETRRVKNILVDNFDKKSNTSTLDHPDPRWFWKIWMEFAISFNIQSIPRFQWHVHYKSVFISFLLHFLNLFCIFTKCVSCIFTNQTYVFSKSACTYGHFWYFFLIFMISRIEIMSQTWKDFKFDPSFLCFICTRFRSFCLTLIT